MKSCKTCTEYSCGGQGTDGYGMTCGNTKSKDEFTQFQTGAVRDTGGKGRMDLLPWSALLRISKHMENALTHYPERNWEKGLPMHSMIDSALRHLAKYVDGWQDEDHLCAATTNLLMAMWTEMHHADMQDIPSRTHGEVSPLASDGSEVRTPTEKSESQEKAKETHSEGICSCYDAQIHVCNGTRERDQCLCGGNEELCDFYPEKRAKHGK